MLERIKDFASHLNPMIWILLPILAMIIAIAIWTVRSL